MNIEADFGGVNVKTIIIDGNAFYDLDGFYDEIERKFTQGLNWHIGRNLNAFNDILRGGFGVHEYSEPIRVVWTNAAKSRTDFGYETTAKYYRDIIKICHSTNVEHIEELLMNAIAKTGQTLFDSIVRIIMDSGDSGHWCTLEIIE
ncbi:MAG: barstar family protein [Peptococcaceae bacterium]|jgi:RNAse (barnase) inhibitor barstar|nr:barstar family protein [Peptococcaceae bacterium]